MKKARKLFTDGYNSFWHVCFGILSLRFAVIIPNFIIYQCIDYTDANLFIDLGEFFVGFALIYFIYITRLVSFDYLNKFSLHHPSSL
jgi:hypothetical protein